MSFIGKLGENLKNFLVNEDRAVASLCGGPDTATISAEIGEHEKTNRFAFVAGWVLDHLQVNHCEDAAALAAILEAAEMGYYAKGGK